MLSLSYHCWHCSVCCKLQAASRQALTHTEGWSSENLEATNSHVEQGPFSSNVTHKLFSYDPSESLASGTQIGGHKMHTKKESK